MFYQHDANFSLRVNSVLTLRHGPFEGVLEADAGREAATMAVRVSSNLMAMKVTKYSTPSQFALLIL